jgi:predicted nucleic acid-binding Zn ribbon protein
MSLFVALTSLPRLCAECNKPIEIKSQHQKFCADACRKVNHRLRYKRLYDSCFNGETLLKAAE